MTVTTASFRTTFPAFASAAVYPDPMVTFWLDVATKQVNAERWAELTDLGIQLYAAHMLMLEARQTAAASKGQSGAQVGLLTSKSADGVSGSYDVATTTEKDAGHWNSTTYGTRYYRYAKMMGAGPVQVGGGEILPATMAWQGPARFF